MSYTVSDAILEIGYTLDDPDLYTYADDVSTDKDGRAKRELYKSFMRLLDTNTYTENDIFGLVTTRVDATSATTGKYTTVDLLTEIEAGKPYYKFLRIYEASFGFKQYPASVLENGMFAFLDISGKIPYVHQGSELVFLNKFLVDIDTLQIVYIYRIEPSDWEGVTGDAVDLTTLFSMPFIMKAIDIAKTALIQDRNNVGI